MRRPRVTINTTVLATAIRIDAGLETDVRRVVIREDRLRFVFEILRAGCFANVGHVIG